MLAMVNETVQNFHKVKWVGKNLCCHFDITSVVPCLFSEQR